MLRVEILVLGCVLVLLGMGLILFGYDQAQPTGGERVVSFLEEISGEAAPPELKPDKTMAYVSMGGGAIAVCAGLLFIVRSRVPMHT
jgi:hypothetical protein